MESSERRPSLCTLPISPANAPPTRTPPHLSNDGTVVPCVGILDLSLSELCQLIQKYQSLQRTIITMTEGYSERSGTVIHRFLVLRLECEDGEPIWLRLDRRLGKARLFVLKSSVTRANDTVSNAFSLKGLFTKPCIAV